MFLLVAALALLEAAAPVVAWPAPMVLVGAGVLSVVLIVVYFAFRLVPAPGAEGVETLDAVGLFTQSLQLATAGACAGAWGLVWPRAKELAAT